MLPSSSSRSPRYPAGRFRDDGQFSGQAFREDHLTPLWRSALVSGELVAVHLDGTLGYGSSFLEEAFGGRRRTDGFRVVDLEKVLAALQ